MAGCTSHAWILFLSAAALAAFAAGRLPAQEVRRGCARHDLACWQQLYASECSRPAATLETCLVFLQHLETARRGAAYSSGVALLLGNTLQRLARTNVSPQAKERYLQRARAAYSEVVQKEPLKASGYLGLAAVAEPGDERVDWLRGAVQAEFQPAHMEVLATTLLSEVGGHTGELEAARVLEDAYTYEATDSEKWRYGASALQTYTVASERYPSATSGRAVDNVLLRIKDDIDYALLHRMLLEPESYLPHLAAAFTTICEKSIAVMVTLDDCMAGLELAVVTAERSSSAGTRRVLAEAVLAGMRTIAGESLPRSAIAQQKFVDWTERLVATTLEPVEVSANVLEAQADYTANLLDRADVLLAAIALVPTRGDLRLKAGATYVNLQVWTEALEQLRVAKYYLPPDEHEPVDELAATADKAYQASFFPPEIAE